MGGFVMALFDTGPRDGWWENGAGLPLKRAPKHMRYITPLSPIYRQWQDSQGIEILATTPLSWCEYRQGKATS